MGAVVTKTETPIGGSVLGVRNARAAGCLRDGSVIETPIGVSILCLCSL
jgi:hypothetical protein